MNGLQELGKALGLRPGVQITGPAALAEVTRLTAERDALAQIKRHIDEVRNGTGWTVQIYGVLLQQCDQYGKTIDTRRAERAEAERDALAAQVARVEEVLEHWRTVDEGNAAYAERIGERSRFADGLASRADMLRAALAGPEANTSDVDVCSGDAYCTSALHVHGCFADTAGPCTDPDEHQPTDQDATGADQ